MSAEIHAVLTELRRRFELLYDSQARGDAKTGSDIDVLVVLRSTVSPCEEIAKTINDVLTFRSNTMR
ncbi:MAG: nucleotidyltransferase domain-containing protein [Candidatus Tectomicrobia bacterium]|uniref:Nucleotidyltransferase domain-containing protein n=1 Tax=Tectimicrobiota bacterium TaxID=2528274 RepID=A0A932CMS1_UNCTE|nr:nucleotidyltransferase domain-containing protein [Candidatus Tectomicrobia bacterium]